MSSPILKNMLPIWEKAVEPVVLPADERLKDYWVEWWYFIALLEDQSAHRWACEMTAARLAPFGGPGSYTCYISIVDIDNHVYLSADRQDFDAYDASVDHLKLVFNAPFGQPTDWRIEGFAPAAPVQYEIEGSFKIDTPETQSVRGLRLWFREASPPHPPLLHGPKLDGVVGFFGDQMGYYSRTRLDVEGGLKIDTKYPEVKGTGWMDHEWGYANLLISRWTFVAIQLDSGEELCVYRVDDKQTGEVGPTHGYLVRSGGVTYTSDAQILPEKKTWGQGYHLHNRVVLDFGTEAHFDLTIRPEFDEQLRVPTGEIALPLLTFWEGAARVENVSGDLVGRAFLELAGYQ